MPPLPDPRHEAFAVAHAQGTNAKAAYAEAGFAPHDSKGSEMAKRKAVAERIAELKRLKDRVMSSDLAHTIADLRDLAAATMDLKSAAAAKEARLALVEANRLQTRLAKEEWRNRPAEPELTLEQWMERHGKPAPA